MDKEARLVWKVSLDALNIWFHLIIKISHILLSMHIRPSMKVYVKLSLNLYRKCFISFPLLNENLWDGRLILAAHHKISQKKIVLKISSLVMKKD